MIEKLIQTPIADYRKHAANLIVIPYLVVSRGMADREEIHELVMKWPINAQNFEGLTLLDTAFHLGLKVG